VQTKISVGKEDSGKSIQLGVGDLLEVNLPETDARAAWRVEVDAAVLAPVSSPTNTQTVWVLDEADQMHQRTFRALKVGRAQLSMTYSQVESGAPVSSFLLEVAVGNPPKPKPIRQALPAPHLLIILCEAFLGAVAAAVLAFDLSRVAANIINEQSQLLQIADQAHLRVHLEVGQGDLLLGLFGTVAMATVAGYLLLRIVTIFAGRMR